MIDLNTIIKGRPEDQVCVEVYGYLRNCPSTPCGFYAYMAQRYNQALGIDLPIYFIPLTKEDVINIDEKTAQSLFGKAEVMDDEFPHMVIGVNDITDGMWTETQDLKSLTFPSLGEYASALVDVFRFAPNPTPPKLLDYNEKLSALDLYLAEEKTPEASEILSQLEEDITPNAFSPVLAHEIATYQIRLGSYVKAREILRKEIVKLFGRYPEMDIVKGSRDRILIEAIPHSFAYDGVELRIAKAYTLLKISSRSGGGIIAKDILTKAHAENPHLFKFYVKRKLTRYAERGDDIFSIAGEVISAGEQPTLRIRTFKVPEMEGCKGCKSTKSLAAFLDRLTIKWGIITEEKPTIEFFDDNL